MRACEEDEPSCLRKARRKEVSPRRVVFFSRYWGLEKRCEQLAGDKGS